MDKKIRKVSIASMKISAVWSLQDFRTNNENQKLSSVHLARENELKKGKSRLLKI